MSIIGWTTHYEYQASVQVWGGGVCDSPLTLFDPFSNQDPALKGFVDWSLTNFTVNKLLEGAFPAFTTHVNLLVYDTMGEVLPEDDSAGFFSSGDFGVFVPYVDFDCLEAEAVKMGLDISDRIITINNTAAMAGLGGAGIGDTKYVFAFWGLKSCPWPLPLS